MQVLEHVGKETMDLLIAESGIEVDENLQDTERLAAGIPRLTLQGKIAYSHKCLSSRQRGMHKSLVLAWSSRRIVGNRNREEHGDMQPNVWLQMPGHSRPRARKLDASLRAEFSSLIYFRGLRMVLPIRSENASRGMGIFVARTYQSAQRTPIARRPRSLKPIHIFYWEQFASLQVRPTCICKLMEKANRGLGLTAHIVDHCNLVLKFPQSTNSTWYNSQFKIFEPLEYSYNVCEAILLWEQYRNMTTVLTREYLNARPDGWLDYAAKRIAQLGADKCYNRSLCEEHLNLILPAKPPFHPHQFKTCAVVGNSGDLLKTEFGKEIDSHEAVIRDNEAPVNEKYAKYVGLKRDFRLVVRGAARNMIKILDGSIDEVLVIKSLTHRDFNAMIKNIPNPVYLFQGIVLRRGAKGTGMKSIELALSICEIVDIYGFTVDPGYTEWTRYFSAPRKGHNPLQGRAYYQLLECLGVIRIHSPMRAERVQDWSDVPSQEVISKAHTASLVLKRSQAGQVDGLDQFGSCKVWGYAAANSSGHVSGSPDMSTIRKESNYSKWEIKPFESLRKEAQDHYVQMEGVSLYKMDGNKLDDLVCVRHSLKSEA